MSALRPLFAASSTTADLLGVFWQPWQVVALAVDHFLRTGGFEAADQSDADQRPVG